MNRRERGEDLRLQVEEEIESLAQQLEQGHTRDFLDVLTFYSRFHRYSISNSILILMQKPHATQCAGYREWERLGFQVREGEKAIWIVGPQLKKMTDEETGEIIQYIAGWLSLPVFDVSQLENAESLPTHTRELTGDFEPVYLKLQAAAGANGILAVEEPLPSGVHGMSTGGRVIIAPQLSMSEKVLVMLHELSHEVLHKSQEGRETPRRQKELEAESTAFVLARIYGLEHPFARDYVLNWKGTVEGLHASMSAIHAAVKTITGWIGIEELQAIVPDPQVAKAA